jgi:hypothetical protein
VLESVAIIDTAALARSLSSQSKFSPRKSSKSADSASMKSSSRSIWSTTIVPVLTSIISIRDSEEGLLLGRET